MPHLIILTWDVHLMDYLAPVSVAHDGLGLGDDCWCQMFSPEPVQDSDPDWTPPTLLLLPHSAHLLPLPPLRSALFTLEDIQTFVFYSVVVSPGESHSLYRISQVWAAHC